MSENHLYHALLADLYHGFDRENEVKHLKTALARCKTNSEKEVLRKKLKTFINLKP